jgi:hypothetical protein
MVKCHTPGWVVYAAAEVARKAWYQGFGEAELWELLVAAFKAELGWGVAPRPGLKKRKGFANARQCWSTVMTGFGLATQSKRRQLKVAVRDFCQREYIPLGQDETLLECAARFQPHEMVALPASEVCKLTLPDH